MIGVVVCLTMAACGCLMAAVWQWRAAALLRRRWLARVRTARSPHLQAGLPGWLQIPVGQLRHLGRRYAIGIRPELVERLLGLAGHPLGLQTDDLYGLMATAALAGMALSAILMALGFGPLTLVMFTAAGLFAPYWWLRQAAAARQQAVAAALPDFLDLLCLTLQAGMGLDQAVGAVSRRLRGALGQELLRWAHEMEMGVEREAAYERLLRRTDCRELQAFIQSLLQALRLGVPAVQTVRVQARSIRAGRAQKARDLAARASPKITLVTTFVVTPAVFLLIIGLFILNLFYNRAAFGLNGLF